MIPSLLYGQDNVKGEPGLKIGSAKAFESVFIDVTIQTADTALFVPVCGKVMDKEILCYGTAFVETQTNHTWHPVKSRPNRMAGYYSPASAEHRLIPPRSEARFSFEFAKDLFAIERGQWARLVIKAWPDRETMVKTWQSEESAMRLIGSRFKFP
jgi:hypothetical protein